MICCDKKAETRAPHLMRINLIILTPLPLTAVNGRSSAKTGRSRKGLSLAAGGGSAPFPAIRVAALEPRC
jgi:hypothetical protein